MKLDCGLERRCKRMKDFLVAWFNIDGEMICSSLTEADIKKGIKQVKLMDYESRRIVNYGYHDLREIRGISKFRFEDNFNTHHLVTWEDRNKLFEKYPELKEIVA